MTPLGFDDALAVILLFEGVDSDHPFDRGGRTRFGISIFTWRRYLQDEGRPRSTPISTLDLDTAKVIYRRYYWGIGRCGEMEWPLSLVHFDSMVQHSKATKLLQEVVGATPDGVIGPQTLALVRRHDAKSLAEDLLWRRLAYYRLLVMGAPTQSAFAAGWMGRLHDLRGFALNRRKLPTLKVP